MRPSKHTKLDVRAALKAKLAGQSYRQIAKVQGVHPETVHQSIAPLLKALPSAEQMEEYRKRQSEVFDATAARIIASITDEDMTKASLQQKATSAAILTDKSRLVSNQSTQNISVIVSATVRGCEIGLSGQDMSAGEEI